jgi:uncharacterized YccA/Bax inhibitor family protein
MSNPVLNDKAFERAASGGSAWGAPDPNSRNGNSPLGTAGWGAATKGTMQAPYAGDQVSPWQATGDRMTKGGVSTAIGVLFALFLLAGTAGWFLVDETVDEFGRAVVSMPPWLIAAPIIGFVAAIVCAFKPKLARVIAPVYAIGQGLFVGAISHLYNAQFDGIVIQAVGATAAVFAVMWFLYTARIIKVTEKLRSIVMAATLGIMVMYLVSFVVSFITPVTFLSNASGLGIALSVFIAGVAAFNLLLDFDLIDRGVEAGAPKYMEWYAAFGLLVTVVWLYLEMLRLLAKLRQN